MNFSLQSPPAAAAPPAPTRDLPPLDRPAAGSPSPRRRKGGGKWKWAAAALVLGTGGVLVAGTGLGKQVKGLFASAETGLIRYKATKATIALTVVERGQLESSRNLDVASEVEGTPQIIFIEPEGTEVKKGQVVCELDSAALKDTLTTQKIATRKAEAEYFQSKLSLDVANIAVNEYENGTFPSDIQTVQGELALAESELARSKGRLDWSEQMFKNKLITDQQLLSEKFALQKAQFTLAQAKTKLSVLNEFTKEKQLTELKANVKKAQSDMLAKEQTYELEKSKEDKLVTQVAKCKLYAPNDGLVVYVNENQGRPGQTAPQIEQGAAVRERQKVFRIPDIAHMRVNTKVHESMVDRVSPGLAAKIKVESFADRELKGKVQGVNTMPDATNMFSSGVNVYTTFVAIDDSLPGMRPGMSAEVTILVDQKDDVVAIPVPGVVQSKGKNVVYVLTATGHVKRPVTLGMTNDKLIEVKDGLSVGEEIALNPTALMTESEKREMFAVSIRPSSEDAWSGDAAAASKKASADGKAAAKEKAAKNAASKGAPGEAGGMGPGGPGGGFGGPGGPGGPGGAEKAKGAAGKRSGRGGMGGGMMGGDPAMMEKFRSASPEEQRKMLIDRGMPEDRVDQILERMRSGGGGGPGGGFGGPGGGGPGGPGGGGAQ